MKTVTPEEIYTLIYESHNSPEVHIIDMINAVACVYMDLLEYAGEKSTCEKLSKIFMELKNKIVEIHDKYGKSIHDHAKTHLH